jgi:hypothetical protein
MLLRPSPTRDTDSLHRSTPTTFVGANAGIRHDAWLDAPGENLRW